MKKIIYLATIVATALIVTSCSKDIDPESAVKGYLDAVVSDNFQEAYSVLEEAMGETATDEIAVIREKEMKEIKESLSKDNIWISGYEIAGIDDLDSNSKDVKTVITYQNGRTSDIIFHFKKNNSDLWRLVSVKTHKYDAFAQKFFNIISIPSNCQEIKVGEDMAPIRYTTLNNKWIEDPIDPMGTTEQYFKARYCEDKTIVGVMYEEIFAEKDKNSGSEFKLEKTRVNDYSLEDQPTVMVGDTLELHPVAVTMTMVNDDNQSRTYTDTLVYAKKVDSNKWEFEKYCIDAKCLEDDVNEAKEQ